MMYGDEFPARSLAPTKKPTSCRVASDRAKVPIPTNPPAGGYETQSKGSSLPGAVNGIIPKGSSTILRENEKLRLLLTTSPQSKRRERLLLHVKPPFRWLYEGKVVAVVSSHKILLHGTIVRGRLEGEVAIQPPRCIDIIVLSNKTKRAVKHAFEWPEDFWEMPCPSYKHGKLGSLLKARPGELASEDRCGRHGLDRHRTDHRHNTSSASSPGVSDSQSPARMRIIRRISLAASVVAVITGILLGLHINGSRVSNMLEQNRQQRDSVEELSGVHILPGLEGQMTAFSNSALSSADARLSDDGLATEQWRIDTSYDTLASSYPGTTVNAYKFNHPHWFTSVFNKISTNFAVPRDSERTLICEVYFQVTKSGRILELQVVSSSGSEAFDCACLNTVSRSAPFPPFPADFKEEIIGITIPFQNNHVLGT